jgi:hypothetical protein
MTSARGPVQQLLPLEKLAETCRGEPVLAIVERSHAQVLLAKVALSNVGQWGL